MIYASKVSQTAKCLIDSVHPIYAAHFFAFQAIDTYNECDLHKSPPILRSLVFSYFEFVILLLAFRHLPSADSRQLPTLDFC